MQEQTCNADAILYNTLLDVLWDTGVAWAQQKAGQLFRQAVEEGHFRQLPYPPPQQQQAAAAPASSEGLGAAAAAAPGSKPEPSSPSAASAASGGSPTAGSAAGSAAAAASASKLELGLQGVSPGVAMLMLHCWFADLRWGQKELKKHLPLLAGNRREKQQTTQLTHNGFVPAPVTHCVVRIMCLHTAVYMLCLLAISIRLNVQNLQLVGLLVACLVPLLILQGLCAAAATAAASAARPGGGQHRTQQAARPCVKHPARQHHCPAGELGQPLCCSGL